MHVLCMYVQYRRRRGEGAMTEVGVDVDYLSANSHRGG